MNTHPFASHSFTTNDGRHVEARHIDAVSRCRVVADFTAEQCHAALKLPDLQKTVRTAIERRLRKLELENAQ